MAKILYVEDNEDNIYMLTNRLTRRGHQVLVARDGQECIDMVQHDSPGKQSSLLTHTPCPRQKVSQVVW